ncbi:GTPase family protein [Ursidibacter arcticus]
MTQFNSNNFEIFESLIEGLDTDSKKELLRNRLAILKNTKLHILMVGATGAGKSSTINAIFNMDIAKVGTTPNPETLEIRSYELNNTVIWDTPGLGDSEENDAKYSEMIVNKLNEKDDSGNGLIDLVVCILDGASRDLGTAYKILKDVIIPSLGDDASQRLIVAINKADLAQSGRGWNKEKNEPEEKLRSFLEDKVKSTYERIKDDTKIEIDPIYYVAGYRDDNEEQRPFNISKLLHSIMDKLKTKKRAVVLRDVNKNKSNFSDDDRKQDYNSHTQEKADRSFWEALKKSCKGVWDDFVEYLQSEKGKEDIKKFLKDFVPVITGFIASIKNNKK